MPGWGCDVVMHETCSCGGFKPVKRRERLIYSDQLHGTGIRREISEETVGSKSSSCEPRTKFPSDFQER